MSYFSKSMLLLIISAVLISCQQEERKEIHRPMDPWAFRSVLDKKPRMITLALDSAFYAAYDLETSRLYKAWEGGVELEGTAYTNKKNVQPSSWGATYYSDSLQQAEWVALQDGKNVIAGVRNNGYELRDNQIYIKHRIMLMAGDTIEIVEQPEFVSNEKGHPGLERRYETYDVPSGIELFFKTRDTSLALKSNGRTQYAMFFDPKPGQQPPNPEDAYDHLGRYWMEKSGCFTCHEFKDYTVGPSLEDIAQRYKGQKDMVEELMRRVREGTSGEWGEIMMTPHPDLSDREIRTMLNYIFTLEPEPAKEEVVNNNPEPEPKQETKAVAEVSKEKDKKEGPKPGFGAPLEGVHPSYDMTSLHNEDFQPRVGGLAFLPDGRLLVTTWDAVGAVYILDNFRPGDQGGLEVKRIAAGLAEPLGLEVVDGEIYVLQKHELTHLVDLDGDEIIDYYRPVANTWGVTDDFHEFAFGLVHKDDHFYLTLSLAMRLMSGERQKSDRGKTIKVSMDGEFEEINYGLRTPNGIGIGVDEELFITDNQGQWLPANKLLHVRQGDFHGMKWVLPDDLEEIPPTAPVTILLPTDEIGNSPSEPIYIHEGPYEGQMLHGDVSHGGIKRDFLEKINGEYQGAVFRFSQGLHAGINRLAWGPDGALYAGGVGMVGGWSWKGRQYGLHRLEYNGKSTFEMLAIRAQPSGFEVEFTQPLSEDHEISEADFMIQQWWYLPTADYGGPKMDLETLSISSLSLSEDRTKVHLEIPGLKEEHLVYFRLAEDLKSTTGDSLWSSEAWYTLNNIPDQ